MSLFLFSHAHLLLSLKRQWNFQKYHVGFKLNSCYIMFKRIVKFHIIESDYLYRNTALVKLEKVKINMSKVNKL